MTTQNAVKTLKFGEHLIYDAYGCDPKILGDKSKCVEILHTLVKMAKMHKLHEPYVISADSNEALGGQDPGGISGFVMIQESHISLHTFTRRGFVTLDLYSCSQFKSEGIVEYLRDIFGAKDDNVIKLERGMKYPADNIY